MGFSCSRKIISITDICEFVLKYSKMYRERFWMLELGTVYPYGLNDRLQSVGNVSKNLKNNINVFSLLNKHKRRKRSHGPKLRWKFFIAFLTKNKAEVYIIC